MAIVSALRPSSGTAVLVALGPSSRMLLANLESRSAGNGWAG